ncbi:dolichyl-phosphate-mannose-protein mannosyltransferase [Corynebacterium glucuronolyticum ATCC 51867]|nr:dolichyl-phosphate-mannose-protein mannosyltransferase [Corynebacterium glucuronolyticum ATCC 51867]
MALGFFTRFFGLGAATDGGTPVFDEKHYAPQAWEILKSSGFLQPGIEANPGFGLVVHPPLSKRIMAMSEAVFGYSPWGWRTMVALFGVAMIALLYLLARDISSSRVAGAYAGVLGLLDGVLLVSSRFGMLDIFLATFVVAALYFLVLDHQQMCRRMYDMRMDTASLGPRLGFRWWRFASGICLGAAVSVKWSGLYFMAFFGLYAVALDWYRRRTFGVEKPLVGALLRDAFPAFASIVILPVALYLWSWRSWFASETGVFRHSLEAGDFESSLPLPPALLNFFYYHKEVLEFHSSLTSSGGHSHPWDSKPWSWLVAARPVLYSSGSYDDCYVGDSCKTMIYLFGTPIIWWLIVPGILWCLWMLITRRDLRFSVPLIGFAAAFLPWLVVFDRQMYFFYAVPMIPFVLVGFALILSQLDRWKTWGHWIVTGYLTAVAASFVWFSPILYGLLIPSGLYDAIMMLPSWR